jgi:glycosyltransferase
MKISVVTVCFNSERTIGDAIRSFLSQTHTDKELLVIDGKSADRTLAIIGEFSSSDVRVVSEKDRGIYDAMNKGLRLFAGDAVGFLNSDDTFHDDRALERIAVGLTEAEAVHGGIEMVTDHSTKRSVRTWKGEPFERGSFRRGWMPPHPTFYIRRSLVEKTGEFDLRYPIAADYDFMLRAMELHATHAQYIPGALVDFVVGGKSSGSLSKVLRGNIQSLRSRREHLGTPFIDPAFFMKPLRKVLQQHWRRTSARNF